MVQQGDLIAGRYRLVERIAEGGMSTVWEAWDDRLHRRIALKRLRPQHGLPEHEAHLAVDRTMREARITARLHHVHAVPVYDVVDDDGVPCLVMQYLPSRSLQAVLADRGTLGVTEVARIGTEVAAALAAAHQAGIVHRDVKPGNILIDEHGSAKITDFGISHALGDVTLTSTGMVTGTPAYLSPEAARGEPAGYPADVFSLGATLFTALEGVPPVGDSDNPIAVLHQVASGDLRTPSRRTPMTPLLLRMLALDPAARPSMTDVQSQLATIAAGGPGAQPDPPPPTRVSVPPSTTVMLPPARGTRPPPAAPPARRRSRGPLAALVIVAALLLLGGLVVLLLSLGNDPGSDVGAGGQTTATSRSVPPPSTHQQPTTQQRAPSSAADSSTTSSSSSTNTSTSSSSTSSGASALTAAIDDYYALLPDNTDAAWSRLTPSYQSGHAGGRDNFDSFWNQFSSVDTSGTHATGASSVETTITYTFRSGRTTREVTDFGLVDDGGTLKIDSSEVVG